MAKRKTKADQPMIAAKYDGLVDGISELLDQSRRSAARTVNSILTAMYWEIGRRIVEFEQGGKARAEYGTELLKRLSGDLTTRFGRGFSKRNLEQMRGFYLGWQIAQTPSAQFEARAKLPADMLADFKSECPAPSDISSAPPTTTDPAPSVQTPPAEYDTAILVTAFPLSWSHF